MLEEPNKEVCKESQELIECYWTGHEDIYKRGLEKDFTHANEYDYSTKLLYMLCFFAVYITAPAVLLMYCGRLNLWGFDIIHYTTCL